MKIREKMVRRFASILKVEHLIIHKKSDNGVTQEKNVVLSDPKDVQVWEMYGSQLAKVPNAVVLTEESDIKLWKDIKEGKASEEDKSALSKLAFKNLTQALYRLLDEAETLSLPNERERIIHDVEKVFKKCGLEVIRYDGTNIALFDQKEGFDLDTIQIGTHSIRDTKTGSIVIKGVVFVPSNI